MNGAPHLLFDRLVITEAHDNPNTATQPSQNSSDQCTFRPWKGEIGNWKWQSDYMSTYICMTHFQEHTFDSKF